MDWSFNDFVVSKVPWVPEVFLFFGESVVVSERKDLKKTASTLCFLANQHVFGDTSNGEFAIELTKGKLTTHLWQTNQRNLTR